MKSLSGAGAISTRTASLLLDTRWAAQSDNNAKQAFATLEFPFTSEPPNLSDWLNALEAVGKQALSQGLVSLDDPR